MAELRRAVLEVETPERVRAVIDKMREQAAAGDASAARVYLDHVIGRPVQAVALTDADGEGRLPEMSHAAIAPCCFED
jgi:hypothetical protein